MFCTNCGTKMEDSVQTCPGCGAANPSYQQPVVEVPVVAQPVQAPVAQPEKVSKNNTRELVSFHIEKEMKRLLGYIKFDTGKSYGDLYCEAVEDLLRKYGKL